MASERTGTLTDMAKKRSGAIIQAILTAAIIGLGGWMLTIDRANTRYSEQITVLQGQIAKCESKYDDMEKVKADVEWMRRSLETIEADIKQLLLRMGP